MKKSEIEEELISKIKFELDTLFYMPGEKIKGIIKIYPGIKIEIKNNTLNLNLKLLQYMNFGIIQIFKQMNLKICIKLKC